MPGADPRVRTAGCWAVALGLASSSLVGCRTGSETVATDVSSPVVCVDLAAFTAPGVEIVAAEEALSPPTDETDPFTGQGLPPLPPHCKVTGTIDAGYQLRASSPAP